MGQHRLSAAIKRAVTGLGKVSGFQCTVLGADGSYPGLNGACSGYLLRTEATAVWLDTGTGTLANLQRHMAPQDLDAVIVTHVHDDHCANLADYRVMLFCADNTREGVPVYAASRVRERLFPNGEHEPYFIWTEIEGGVVLEIGDFTFRFSETDHPVPTLAVRTDAHGRSLAYSSDTGTEWQLSELGSDFDVALVEAALRKGEEDGPFHLSPSQAGLMAREAGAKRLILTHLRPDHDRETIRSEAVATFGADIELAETGATYNV